MKKSLLLLLFSLAGCGPNGVHGWFGDPPPASGNKMDVNVYYKNTCGVGVIVFYSELSPGSNIACENLTRLGPLADNESIGPITIHQGKIGYIVFALNENGKCSSGERKFEGWIHTENATSAEAHFTSCP